MSQFGFRDGAFNVKTLKLGQKRYVQDTYPYVLGSATALLASATAVSTAALTLGTTVDAPRTIKIVNNLQAASERAIKMVIKGYTGQGEYAEETLTLGTAAGARTAGSVAFAYVSEVVPAVATKGFGTYSTVSIHPTQVFGITEFCDDESDMLEVDLHNGAGAVRTSESSFISTTTFDKVNQTINLGAFAVVGSTVNIKYRSRFQTKDKY